MGSERRHWLANPQASLGAATEVEHHLEEGIAELVVDENVANILGKHLRGRGAEREGSAWRVRGASSGAKALHSRHWREDSVIFARTVR